MKFQFVDEARKAWKWFSVQAMVLAGIVQTTWIGLPADLKVAIPASFVSGVTVTLLLFGIFGRLVKQSKPDES